MWDEVRWTYNCVAYYKTPMKWHPEVGIYKRKQESKKEKKERKHAFDQESGHENDQE